MTSYKAPLTDMKFLMKTQSQEDFSELFLVVEEAARFVEQEILASSAIGDQQGCYFAEGKVSVPEATRTAYQQYVAGGWMGISMPEEFGGQGLPNTIGSKLAEMLTSSNHALSMIPALTMSACKALMAFGSESLKAQYLPELIQGNWTGTMCLTEPHCGSDLGLIKASAVQISEDRYEISGSKIFISGGEHNLSENIVHLVLARIQGAPSGVKGLSLFLVPKYLKPQYLEATSASAINNVHCIGIEEKMGIHANPTCSMSFENATGFLVGQPNQGIVAMFTMMNEMRLGTAMQGVGLSEHAFQKSYAYAIERTQGKTLNQEAKTEAPADALLAHADVRRMLLTQKAFAEGGRALCHFCNELLDIVKTDISNTADRSIDETQQAEAEKLLGLLTPIAKAFLTETSLESASHAIQIYGGHGYITENGVEQLYRDGRIATLYEGTTGIQALDLLGRKVLGDQAAALLIFTKKMHKLCKQIETDDECSIVIKALAPSLATLSKEWPKLAQEVGIKAFEDHEEVGAAAFDFLMYSGYACLAYFWLMQAYTANSQVEASSQEFSSGFLNAKLKTAQFYFERILPHAESHKLALRSGKQSVSSHEEDEWMFD